MRDPTTGLLREERGVALPLALLGLVTVSLLVSTALVTSSTELAISGAHQGATQGLYSAEGGLQAYVAQRGTTAQNDAGSGPFTYTPPGGGPAVKLTVIELGTQLLADQRRLRLYSVLAYPAQNGGRTVSAMITQIMPPPVPPNLNITSAMTVAGDLSVSGNAFDVNGRSNACGSAGVEALRISSESQISVGNDQQSGTRLDRFVGTSDAGASVSGQAAIEVGGTRVSLVNNLLDGKTIDELAAGVPTANWRYRNQNPAYTSAWLASAMQAPGGVVVVDAQGGTISVSPGTYTGILIVLNGSVSISGNIDFNGIILAEQNFSLAGNVTISGAIASMAMDGQNLVSDAGDDSDLDGTVSVSYNKCLVDSALKAYANAAPNGGTPEVRRTISWLEVVR
ncbi:MAG: DUF2572 family protein [Gemmatimonadetes bacterium]|nr:DUF2572 family protein [Gemmatimonadota bacterium]